MKSPTNDLLISSAHQQFLPRTHPALQCICDTTAVELNVAHKGESELGVDAILKLARQAIGFWQRLRNCRACLESRLEELLAAFDKTINFLCRAASEADFPTIATFSAELTGVSKQGVRPGQGTGPGPGTGSLPGSAPTSSYAYETNVHNTATSSQPVRTPPMTLGGGIPPMSFGKYTLDKQQSLALLRSTYCRILSQVASTLYEIRQVEGGIDGRLSGITSDLLYNVLHLMETFNERNTYSLGR
ncbi:uncharacterized protein F4822DRAFT_46236 [Hypoxylon trugodes]|uniref:uncharacterized protein n=1 Tax=Hypoxylon trugodes TaxID=326681 RepID=UPI0021961B56|nr:uncharacterized protein F4822DRAFT_46236 [Hypoxylon trugodes]KAI1394382.1 hypothetical protein F4822DRAFT_46236 [Hypoxylon trugodes]